MASRPSNRPITCIANTQLFSYRRRAFVVVSSVNDDLFTACSALVGKSELSYVVDPRGCQTARNNVDHHGDNYGTCVNRDSGQRQDSTTPTKHLNHDSLDPEKADTHYEALSTRNTRATTQPPRLASQSTPFYGRNTPRQALCA